MKTGRFVSVLVLVLTCLATACGYATAAPGDLDRFFGREGLATFENVPGAYVAPADMVVGPDNSIYVLRRQEKCSGSRCTVDLLVTRHNPNGSLDPSFGAGGISGVFGSPGYGGFQQESSLAVGRDGKVVVASTDEGDLILVRLNGDGSFDRTFADNGIARRTLGAAVSRAKVAVQGDGRIVVGAESEPGYGTTAVIVMRYTQQGASDPAFNGGTPLVTSLGSGLGGFGLVGAAGAVIAGPGCCGVAGDAVHVGRLSAGGVFDRRFGNRGHRFVDDVARGAEVGAVVTLADGRIDVIGSGRRDDSSFALRLLPHGRLDPAFGNRGIVYMKSPGLRVAGAAVDGRGRLVIGGITPVKEGYRENTRLTVLRRLASGRPDRTFGGGLPVRLRSLGDTRATALGLQTGGRIVVLVENGRCERSCAPGTTILVRYLGGSGGARCLGRKATIVGTRVGESLVGTPRRDVIAALGGDDTVRGRGGNDLICGGRGNDRLSGGPGKDRFAGGPGRDHIGR